MFNKRRTIDNTYHRTIKATSPVQGLWRSWTTLLQHVPLDL